MPVPCATAFDVAKDAVLITEVSRRVLASIPVLATAEFAGVASEGKRLPWQCRGLEEKKGCHSRPGQQRHMCRFLGVRLFASANQLHRAEATAPLCQQGDFIPHTKR